MVPLPVVLDIVETDLRPVFLHEATGFTRWLSQPENLQRLGRALGITLALVDREVGTGTFRLDILARDLETDALVVIENQFARSDHDHLGKVLSYLAAKGARSAIWVAESFADEHRAAIEWLNDMTPPEIAFWAVVPRMLRVGDGPPGLRFEVEVRPNRAVKAERASGRQYDPEIRPMRERYWKVFGALLAADPDLAAVVTRHGGAAGHLTLFPDARFRAITPRVNVLAYLSLGAGQRLAYVHVRPNPEESPESWHPRITALRAELAEVLDRPLEGDWSSDTGLHNLASRHLAQVKTALQALTRAFAPEAEAADPR